MLSVPEGARECKRGDTRRLLVGGDVVELRRRIAGSSRRFSPRNHGVDVLPEIWTILRWNFPFMIARADRGEFYEEIEVHRRADRVCLATS